jgi:RimJ/RimL family protein N-acetyltransferase
MTELRTQRLELRRWTEADLDEHAALIADPEVNRYVGGPTGRDDAWRQIAIFLGHREMRGWTSSSRWVRSSVMAALSRDPMADRQPDDPRVYRSWRR